MTAETLDVREFQHGSQPQIAMSAPGAQPADIVVHTDFTKESIEAANAATAIAQRFRSNLWVVHSVNNALGALPKRARDAALSRIREMLEEEANRLRQRGVTVQTALLGGGSQNCLANAIGAHTVGLSVVSKQTLPAHWSWLKGTVAEEITANTRAPILQIQHAAPFEAWGQQERPLHIVVGVDFLAVSDAALRWVAGLMKAGPCGVMVVHINTVFPQPQHSVIEGAMEAENRPTQDSLQNRNLNVRVRDILGGAAVRIQIVENPGLGSIGGLLVHIARENQADLLVIGNHRSDISDPLNSSVSHNVLRRATTNVACVPLPIDLAQSQLGQARRAQIIHPAA